MSWTEERVDVLKKLYAAGISATEIAVQLNCGLTRNAVIGKAHRLGLDRPAPQSTARKTPTLSSPPSKAPAPKVAPVSLAAAPIAFPPPVRRVKPDEKLIPATPKGKHISILDLRNNTCRWPFDNHDPETSGSFLFCGDPSADLADDRPYCPFHARKAGSADVAARGARLLRLSKEQANERQV